MMKLLRFAPLGALTALGLVASMAQATPITYVDASTSNTTLADGTAYTPEDPFVNDDDLWGLRTFGNSSTVYNSNDSNSNPGEDAPELRTTISGLTAGSSYKVYTYFWGNGTSGNVQWDVMTGLVSGALTSYDWTNATDISGETPSTYFTNVPDVIVAAGNGDLLEVSHGTVVADGSGNINIYVDDFPGNPNRTWYDGVGYSLIPEPTSFVLLGIGGLLLTGGWRRRS